MTGATRVPLVGISCNYSEKTEFPSHGMSDKYVTAVVEGTGGLPILIPAGGGSIDVDGLIEHLDGVLLTGGVSNVEPRHYDGSPSRDGTEHDPGRDGVALPLIRAAVAGGLPLLGICRGIQEMNVAFGGTLHQHLHEVSGRDDHRRERHRPLPDQFEPRQRIRLTAGGLLAGLAGAEEARVNSLHGQGIDRLATGLAVEAVADDGTIEAVRVKAASTFAVGVQWHAEWRLSDHPFYLALFRAFGDAVWARARRRAGGAAARPVA